MSRKLTLTVAVLLWCCASTAPAANIIVVTQNVDWDRDGVSDDQGLVDWLVAEGHCVDVRRNHWDHLDSQRIAELNAADLIIVSRLTDSGLYDYGSAAPQWNSVKTPLLLMNAYFTRPGHWNWVSSATITNTTPDIYAEAVDVRHPVFRSVQWQAPNPSSAKAVAKVVQIVDPTIGTGITSFLGTTEVGNGHLLARPAGKALGWITEWDAGVEFYPGAGQFAGGKRLLFCAGTQEVGGSREGEFNLAPEGRRMLRNAMAHLLGGANIIVVTDDRDTDLNGVRDDYNLEPFLVSAGHFVDVRPNYWRQLDGIKLTELRAADLIIFSRTTDSTFYDDGDEPYQWNSLPIPLLQMNPYLVRNIRWKWVNSGTTTNDTAAVYLEAVEPNHPIFRNVPLIAVEPGPQGNSTPVVPMIDPNVGSGITSFSHMASMSNGRLLARPMGLDLGWIAEWDAGVEFFPGAGQYAGAKRLLFCAGTQEIETKATPVGQLNFTAEGLQMFRNAITYLLQPESQPQRRSRW
jgi:hypothetical protein